MTRLNLRRLAAAAATFSLSFTASAAINIGLDDKGLSLGNSKRFTGVRLNLRRQP